MPADEPGSLLDDLGGPDDAYDTDEPVLPRSGVRSPATDEEDGPALKAKKFKKKKKKSAFARWVNNDEPMSSTDVLICVVCPGIGVIAGIIYLITGRGKGLKVLGLAVLGNIAWGAIRLAFQYAAK